MREDGVYHPFPRLALGTVALPFFAFLSCIFWSLFFDFENTTSTHCEVAEFAPSISAVIGSDVPQKYIWNICVAIHAAPRFLFSTMYRNFYKERLSLGVWTGTLVTLNYGLNLIENFSLLGLSFIGSSEVFEVHAFFFILFLFTYIVSMLLLMWYLIPYCGFQMRSRDEMKALVEKKKIVKLTIASSVLALYFYWRHNEYCEPYVYSLFGVFEYVLILGNMYYHALSRLDFADWTVSVGPTNIPK
ncbi:post-GPI attachment to proteins factor 2 [Eurytemora carolleeae]|uniref:post-GPI attachment to proteins factor 2 n=1 Tax=Eurytemora carolleeae TaxID=1294199 RepID=UPI000C77E686|nr:post-GPI attachment to proteins factor 2 [Eurytemora carolleeae]|eukprot:XP_023334910.1 post-GPI attachment to proteins factor 2-like [Eurytemora affinis]